MGCTHTVLRSKVQLIIRFYFSYVQHQIKSHAEIIKKALLVDKGTVLVAGSSKDMPKAVKEAITEAIGDDEYVQHMLRTGRYQEETWS